MEGTGELRLGMEALIEEEEDGWVEMIAGAPSAVAGSTKAVEIGGGGSGRAKDGGGHRSRGECG